jgi:DNA phosphorothioation-associated DGQHR protein 1
MSNFIDVPTIYVEQPFSNFYLASIPVRKLIKVCYSFPAVYGDDMLNGVQRGLNSKRIENISKYSQTDSALFPNSIILSANMLKDGTTPENDPWTINPLGRLIVPTENEYASIVDGQHRIEGLKKAIKDGGIDESFSVVCAIYFELTAPEQAEVFATINFNQQKVDKSLAYQLFGYDLDSTESEFWAPDTLAIYLSRLLNKDDGSPFINRINFGMKQDIREDPEVVKVKVVETAEAKAKAKADKWTVSTSTIVEGILRLISKNPAADRYKLHKKKILKNKRGDLECKLVKEAPLRNEYIRNNDIQLFELISDYFKVWEDLAWSNSETSFMYKTIGIQASFDILRFLCEDYGLDKVKILERISEIDVQKLGLLNVNFSGIGRGQIRDELKKQLKIT